MSTTDIWGPKVWRLLHLLSIASDRRDVPHLWISVIRETAKVLPCIICREHAFVYLRTYVFFKGVKLSTCTGKDIQQQIFKDICNFHNEVNIRLKKRVFTYEEAYETLKQERTQILIEARSLYEELKFLWKGRSLLNWTKAISLLFALLDAGPN